MRFLFLNFKYILETFQAGSPWETEGWGFSLFCLFLKTFRLPDRRTPLLTAAESRITWATSLQWCYLSHARMRQRKRFLDLQMCTHLSKGMFYPPPHPL